MSPAALGAFLSAFLLLAATFLFRNIFLWLVEQEITGGKESALQACWSTLVIYAERGTGVHCHLMAKCSEYGKRGIKMPLLSMCKLLTAAAVTGELSFPLQWGRYDLH